jgi:hypothetical protein
MQRLTPGRQRDERLGWIIDQLSLAAVAKGQVFTSERLRINAEDLIDIPQDRLAAAFAKARRELDYAPGVAEIRRFAAADEESLRNVEAQAAWTFINEYLRKWGVDKLPIRSNGKWIIAPLLEPRLEYALRRIGGLWRLSQVTDQSYHFMQRDFCEAYTLAPAAESVGPQLMSQFGDQMLLGKVKQLGATSTTAGQMDPDEPQEAVAAPARSPVRELTPERKAELRRQLDEELAKRSKHRQ